MSTQFNAYDNYSIELLCRKKSHIDLSEQSLKRKLTLRKEKLQQKMNMKRYKGSNITQGSFPSESAAVPPIFIEQSPSELLQQYCNNITKVTNHQEFIDSVMAIRKLLSKTDESDKLCQYLQDNEVLQKLLTIIPTLPSESEILLEIIWIFTNVSASPNPKFTQFLYEQNIIGIIFDLIKPCNYQEISCELIQDISWLLANISEDHNDIIMELNDKGIITLLINYLINNPNIKVESIDKILFFLNVILKKNHNIAIPDQQKLIHTIIQGIPYYIQEIYIKIEIIESLVINSLNIIENCCLDDIYIYKFFNTCKGIQMLFRLIDSPEKIQLKALRVIGTFAFNDTSVYSSILFQNNILDVYGDLLQKENFPIDLRKEIAWTLSNLTIGVNHEIEIFFNHRNILDILFDQMNYYALTKYDSYGFQKEIFWTLSNLSKINSVNDLSKLVNLGYFSLATHYISNTHDYKLPIISIEAIQNILIPFIYSNDKLSRSIIDKFESSSLLTQISNLVFGHNEKISNKAGEFIKWYSFQFETNSMDLD